MIGGGLGRDADGLLPSPVFPLRDRPWRVAARFDKDFAAPAIFDKTAAIAIAADTEE